MPWPAAGIFSNPATTWSGAKQAQDDFLAMVRQMPGGNLVTGATPSGGILSVNRAMTQINTGGPTTIHTITTTVLPDGSIIYLFHTGGPDVTIQSSGNITLMYGESSLLLSNVSQGIALVKLAEWLEIGRWGLEDKRDVSFAGSWGNGPVSVRYWKDTAGYVQLEGLATRTGTPPSDDTICTVPAEYGISATEAYFPAVDAHGFVPATVRVVSNYVRFLIGGGADPIIDLSSVRYRCTP